MSKENPQDYRGNGNHEFEEVYRDQVQFVQRLRVPGGWIYETTFSENPHAALLMTSVFVPMPEIVHPI